jgi:hypothetical protein
MNMMHTRTLLTVIAAMALLGFAASCPGKGGAKPQLQVPLDETALSVVNRLALYKSQSESDPAEYTAAREQALREARDAVLDSGNPFEARVTIACWLQQMGQELPDRVIPELTGEAPGHLELDPRILFSLAQVTWNAAQQAAQDPFRWHEEEPAGRRGELALSLFRQASDAAPQSALFALTAASNDLFLTGKLNGTLISWDWPEKVQEECAGRIKPLLERFIAAADNTCMTGPPYFTPLTNAQSYPPDAVGGGVYDGSTASSLLPATAVLVLRDMIRQRNTEEMKLATDAVAKLLAMEPQIYSRLSAAAISAREIAQTLTAAMAGPSERGAANDLAADLRSFHRAMDEDWLDRYAKDYAETAPKNYERARRIETGFIGRYIGDMKAKVARITDFISTLKPEDILADAPPAPW